MKRHQIFLVSLLPLQFWGMLIFFIYADNPTTLKETINTLVILAYNVLFNSLEAVTLGLFVWLLSFLLPKSLSTAKRITIQLGIIGAIILAGVLSQVLLYTDYPIPQWDFLGYVAVNLINTKLYMRIFFMLLFVLLTVALSFVTLAVFRSDRDFSRAVSLLGSLSSLAWFYVAIDCILLTLILLRGLNVV
jgi:hypothetical protein